MGKRLTRLRRGLFFSEDTPNKQWIVEKHLEDGGEYSLVASQNVHCGLTGFGKHAFSSTDTHGRYKVACQPERNSFWCCLYLSLLKSDA